jgi:predicted phage terminase large subunit-like protein
MRMKALDSDGVPLWQSKFSREFLQRAREEAGPVIFNAQYQNDVELMRNRIFKQEWLLRYEREPKDLKIAIGADLAIGLENHNDYFALVAVGRDDLGRFYVLDTMRGRFTFEEQFRKIVEMYHKHDRRERRVVRVGVEATAYQEALPQRLKRETALPVVSIRPSVDKISRAHALTAFFESGRVLFRDDASQSALIEELLLFPEAEHDDLFDALEIAISLAAESAGYSEIFRRKIPDVLPPA